MMAFSGLLLLGLIGFVACAVIAGVITLLVSNKNK